MTVTTRVKVTTHIVMGIYSLAFLLYGITLPSTLTRVLAAVPFVVVLSFALLDNVIWRWGPLPGLLRQPVIGGTWHGQLRSYRRDESGVAMESNHDIVLVIRQSLTTVSVTMFTSQSMSRSAVAGIVRMQGGDYVLQYQYLNEPVLRYRRAGSPVHAGGAKIHLGGDRPTSLDGEYWTARETSGTFAARHISDRLAATYQEGQRLLTEGEER